MSSPPPYTEVYRGHDKHKNRPTQGVKGTRCPEWTHGFHRFGSVDRLQITVRPACYGWLLGDLKLTVAGRMLTRHRRDGRLGWPGHDADDPRQHDQRL